MKKWMAIDVNWHVEEVYAVIKKNHWLTVHEVSEEVEIYKKFISFNL